MALVVSSLSVALQGFADFLDGQFAGEVVVSLDAPQRAQEVAKGLAKSLLNVFFYRISPSGFHSEAGFQDPLFIRAHVLLTCFPAGQGAPENDADLRVLGNAMAFLHSAPTIPVVLPGPAPGNAGAEDFRTRTPVPYRIQAVMQALTMEEVNHIWTTQGTEIAYRLSTGYELALIPIEPITARPPVGAVRAAILDITASSVPVLAAGGILAYSATPIGIPLPTAAGPPPANWLPLQLFVLVVGNSNVRSVVAGTASVDVALVGPLGNKAAVSVQWTRNGGAIQVQAAQAFTVAAQRLDDPAATVALTLTNAAPGDRAVIIAVPADAAGVPVPGASAGNVLTLTVGA